MSWNPQGWQPGDVPGWQPGGTNTSSGGPPPVSPAGGRPWVIMRVTTRNFSLVEMVSRAWGSEFRAPDHGIYEFSNGRRFDSTDIGETGIYKRR